MSTRHETIMQALVTRLQGQFPNIKRNIELPERISGSLQVLRDGGTNLETPMLPGNGGMFLHVADLELLTDAPDPAAMDAAIAAMAKQAGEAIATDNTLNGLADYIVPQPLDFVAGDGDTGTVVRGAVLPLEIYYYADSATA